MTNSSLVVSKSESLLQNNTKPIHPPSTPSRISHTTSSLSTSLARKEAARLAVTAVSGVGGAFVHLADGGAGALVLDHAQGLAVGDGFPVAELL